MQDFFSGLSFTGWDAALALVVIVAAWVLSRYARRAAEKIMLRVEIPDDLRSVGVRITGYIVVFLGVGVALGFLGASIQPVLAVVILVAVVALLALRGIADNVAAGVVIQTRRPIRIGDWIEALEFIGRVRELNSRAVIIETNDGRIVHLPNQKILDNPLINHTTAGRHASEVQVRIGGGYQADVVHAIDAALRGTPGVLADPAPTVSVSSVEPDRTTMTAKCWHKPSDGAAVTSAAVVAISARLSDRGEISVVAPPPVPPLVPPPSL